MLRVAPSAVNLSGAEESLLSTQAPECANSRPNAMRDPVNARSRLNVKFAGRSHGHVQ